jgi:hypothetical protein
MLLLIKLARPGPTKVRKLHARVFFIELLDN